MVWSCSRVTASRIAISLDDFLAVAMNLLHGDHIATTMSLGSLVFAMLGSHEVGAP